MKKIILDRNQKKVIKNNSQNLLVIAGAGSGKTLTLIYKIKYLIKNNIKPTEILCITFTKASATSLKQKLLQENIDIKVKTFHSLGYEIIKKAQNIQIVKENTLDNIIMKTLKQYKNLNNLIGANFIEIGKGKALELQDEIIKNSNYINYLKDIIKTFINLFKSNNYKTSAFELFLQKNKKEHFITKQNRHKQFLKLVKQIYLTYEDYLEYKKEIDFHDMINSATKIVNNEGIYPYKYIIIDEYQDTSLNKCKLIKTIQKKTKAHLIAVGDDWQSIYRFTGSNLDIFTNFKKYFPNAKIIKLKKTYRNSQQLLKITRKFITKNPYQIDKKILSNKTNIPIYIYYYKDNLKKIWEKIINQTKEETLVLGRNNKDVNQIPCLNKYMKYMTIHKSKGLEAENVIIINLQNTITSIPNKTKESEYLKYVIPPLDNYPYAEERRLFYVALTRTKNHVILLVNKNNPSIFINELLKESSKYIKIIEID